MWKKTTSLNSTETSYGSVPDESQKASSNNLCKFNFLYLTWTKTKSKTGKFILKGISNNNSNTF